MIAWIDPTFIASAIAAVAAVVSAWIGAAVYLRSLQDDIPKIGMDTRVVQRPAPHIEVRLYYVNKSETEWQSTHFEVLKPAGWHVLHDSKVPRGNYTDWEPNMVDIDALPDSCDLDYRLRPRAFSGEQTAQMEQVHLFPPRLSGEVTVSMRVILRSIEPIQRRKAIVIKRQVTLTPRTATA